MKDKTWIVFAALGSGFIYWGLHQVFVIPATSGEHWEWLAPTPELIEYIKFRFQNLGAFTIANGALIGWAALAGFKNRERWAWAMLVTVPLYILFLTGIFYWLSFATIPLGLIAGWALWASRGEMQPAAQSRRGLGWVVVFIVGVLLAWFAYDAFFVIPALDVSDPDRGWAWLTTVPAHIDYIKLYFRVYGIHVFAFSAMALIAVVFGLREGYWSAWKVLWLVPLLFFVHVTLWPWAAVILIGLGVLAVGGLWWAAPKMVQSS